MPIRDLESFADPRADVRVLANRGANGIDGVTSTALGVALTGAPTTLLIGDLALLHDQGALTGLADRDVDLELVVVDNDGGGIFSFLPQANALEPGRFEQLFGTPQRVDLAGLLAAHGITARVVTTAADFDRALVATRDQSGVRATIVRTDRAENVAVHDELTAAVAVALGT
jgi:2-succinyl-5-enolpyruvyl-6-hydroxy-3-cyclohexene-1-carboxylate synthase